jgi:hypothetical protein
MTRFIETDKGWINLAHVGKIASWKRGDERFTEVYAPDGEVLGRASYVLGSLHELEDDPPIVPALPGYSLVTVLLDSKPPAVVLEEPIIAFRVQKHGLEPYTLDGLEEFIDSDNKAIKGPDGKLTLPGMESWDSLQLFIDDCIKEATKVRKPEIA